MPLHPKKVSNEIKEIIKKGLFNKSYTANVGRVIKNISVIPQINNIDITRKTYIIALKQIRAIDLTIYSTDSLSTSPPI